MKHLHWLATPLILLALSQSARAQHCAPIRQSFLSEVSIKWVKNSLRMRFEYTKHGGIAKDAYQAYIVAYLEKDAKQVPAPKGKGVLDAKASLVLHTQLIRRNAQGVYDLEYAIDDDNLVKRVIKHMGLGAKDRNDWNDWRNYKDLIQIAVFIPFLDDKKYSNLKGLPKDRHECNYGGERALLFQTLPYRLDFMTARTKELTRRVWVGINGDKPEPR